jgi:formate dehydrogenase maturation protein FdhE
VTTLQEIETAIEQLSPAEFDQLATWIDKLRETDFDHQIEADAKVGRLDVLWAKAEQEIAKGKARPLDELLHD